MARLSLDRLEPVVTPSQLWRGWRILGRSSFLLPLYLFSVSYQMSADVVRV